jgi:hypothetical protein
MAKTFWSLVTARSTQRSSPCNEWLDDSHVLYGTYRSSQAPLIDVYAAPIDGSEPARVFLPGAESPIVVR